jgi:hypothetical protein
MSIALHRVGMFIYIYNFRSHKDTLPVEVFFPWFVENGYSIKLTNQTRIKVFADRAIKPYCHILSTPYLTVCLCVD